MGEAAGIEAPPQPRDAGPKVAVDQPGKDQRTKDACDLVGRAPDQNLAAYPSKDRVPNLCDLFLIEQIHLRSARPGTFVLSRRQL